MINPIDKILTEWAYRVHDGMPDPSDNYHVVQLEQYLNELRLPRSVVKKVLEKVRKYKNNALNKKLKRVGKPWGSDAKDVSKRGASDKDVDSFEDDELASIQRSNESEKEISKRIKDKNQKSARKHTQDRLSEERKEMIKNNHPEYPEYEEDIKQLEALFDEFTHPDTPPERKKEIAKQLKDSYGLTTNSSTVNEETGNPKNVKLYIKKLPSGKPVPRWMYKLLSSGGGDPSGGGPNRPQTNLTTSLNEHLDDDDKIQSNSVGGDSESAIAQKFSTAAKPSFTTPKRTKTRKNPKYNWRKKDPDRPGYDLGGNPKFFTDPVVNEIFSDPPISDLEDKEPGTDSFHSLEGPVDENGNIIPANTPENKRKHMEWLIKNNQSNKNIKTVCDKYIKILNAEKPRNESEIAKYENLKKAIDEHDKEMNRIIKKHGIPSPEAEAAVKKANAKLMDDIHKAHPDVAGGIAKQVAEIALVQQELAAGEECYLPSAGNFPGGDKLRVTRDGTKVEKVAGVSVKFGRGSNNTQIYGFPAEAASVGRYAEVPKIKNADGTEESDEEHKARQHKIRTRSGGKVGQEGYATGVRDDIVDNPEKQEQVIEQAGMGNVVKKKHRKEFHRITKEIKDEVEKFKREQKVLGKSEDQIEIDLQAHLKEFMSKKDPKTGKSINDIFEEVIDREELALTLTGSKKGKNKDGTTHSNANMAKSCDPIEFLNLATVGSVIREGQGMPSLSWNHQEYNNGEYHSETVEADERDMTNLACWGFLSRMYRSSGRAKGGGILTTGTGECG